MRGVPALLGTQSGPKYVGGTVRDHAGGTITVAYPDQAKPGDFALVMSSVTPSGFTLCGGSITVHYKFLTSTDIANGVALGNNAVLAVYTGINAISNYRTYGDTAQSDPDYYPAPGFTKTANSKFIIAICFNSGGSAPCTVTGFAARGFLSSAPCYYIGERKAESYVNGTDIAMGGSSNGRIYCDVYELL